MGPSLLLLQPDLAAAGVRYRFNRLPGARAKAQSYPDGGFQGAMFPWVRAFPPAQPRIVGHHYLVLE